MDDKMSSKMILRAHHDFAWYCLFVPVLPARRPRNYELRAELVRIVETSPRKPQLLLLPPTGNPNPNPAM